MKKTILFLILLCSIIPSNYAQKKIKAKGDYKHSATNFVFPTQLYDLARVGIYSFDREKENIGVVYENQKNRTTITLYVYPAGIADEHRFRSEFLKSLQEIANSTKTKIDAHYQIVQYEGDYICNGFIAAIENKRSYNSLTIYECGRWFFKIRITSDGLDSLQLSDFEQKLINHFEPSQLTALNPLKSRSNIIIAPIAFKDSVLLDCVLAFTMEKVKWAIDSVSEKERASGFPSIHLGMHVAALKAFLNYRNEKNATYSPTAETQALLDELQEISDNDFFEEFVLDQYNTLLRLDEYNEKEEEWENYLKWKNNRISLFDLPNKLFSVIIYVE